MCDMKLSEVILVIVGLAVCCLQVSLAQKITEVPAYIGGNGKLDCCCADQTSVLIWSRHRNGTEPIESGDEIMIVSSESSSKLVFEKVVSKYAGKYFCFLDQGSGNWTVLQGYNVLVKYPTPPPPKKFSVFNSTHDTITLTWDPIPDLGVENQQDITVYRVRLSQNSTAIWTSQLLPSTTVTVPDLSPYTMYTAELTAILRDALSTPESLVVHTKEGFPEWDSNPRVLNVTATSFVVEWDGVQQDKLFGPFLYIDVGYAETLDPKRVFKQIEDVSQRHWTLPPLEPYVNYTVEVSVCNKGQMCSRPVTVEQRTSPAPPPQPSATDYAASRSASIWWTLPRRSNGRIKTNGPLKNISISWARKGAINASSWTTRVVDPSAKSFTVRLLDPNTMYVYNVTATNIAGSSTIGNQGFTTDYGEASKPRNISVEAQKNGTVEVWFDLPERIYGPTATFHMTVKDHKNNSFYLPEPFEHSLETRQRVAHVFELPEARDFEQYWLELWVDTPSLYRKDMTFNGERAVHPFGIAVNQVQTGPSSGGLAKTVVPVVALLVLIVAGGLVAFYFLRRKRREEYSRVSINEGRVKLSIFYDEILTSDAVPTDKFEAHVKCLHKDSDFGFSDEYKRINDEDDKTIPMTVSKSAECKSKNRYENIHSFDHTRVQLQKKGDYINANYIDGYLLPRAFIATQGPLPETFEDFWRMVWEQNSALILMITKLKEKNRLKCGQYWPEPGAATYGALTVKWLHTFQYAFYTLRVFLVKHNKALRRQASSERLVYQLHYTAWPDHGVPSHPLPALAYVRHSVLESDKIGPVIVHCSAGVGRTGTYICIASALRMLKDRQLIDIKAFLTHIRRQRMKLVQTEDQYAFVHDVVLENLKGGHLLQLTRDEVIARMRVLRRCGRLLKQAANHASRNNSPWVSAEEKNGDMSQVPDNREQEEEEREHLLARDEEEDATEKREQGDAERGTQGSPRSSAGSGGGSKVELRVPGQAAEQGKENELEKEFALVCEYQPRPYEVEEGKLPENVDKNRPGAPLPVDRYRVSLPVVPGERGSDYINASYLHGYRSQRQYIVTQHPLEKTCEDFWRMAWDQGSCTVALLTPPDDPEYAPFWPAKGESLEFKTFRVTCKDEHELLKHIVRDILIQSEEDDVDEQHVRLLSAAGEDIWPAGDRGTATLDADGAGLLLDLPQTLLQFHSDKPHAPLVVVDRLGGSEAAALCGVCTLRQQLQDEQNGAGHLDVYMTAKLYHCSRPGMFHDAESYRVLYEAAGAMLSVHQAPRTTSFIETGVRHSGSNLLKHFYVPLPRTVSHRRPPAPAADRPETTV